MQRQQEELYLDTKGQETEVQEENMELEFKTATAENQVWSNNHAEKHTAITTLKNHGNNHADDKWIGAE